MKSLNLMDRVVDIAITGVSCATAATTFVYCVGHDIMNDPELSIIAGSTVSGLVFGATSATCHAVKNGTNKMLSKFSPNKKSKVGSKQSDKTAELL